MLDGRRTSIGPSLPNQEVEIHDDNGLPTPPGVEGEIVIRGHCTMSGYLHNSAATEAMFRGGWVHTGDLGYYLLDAEGRKYFHVCGRTKEIAKRGGAMVSLLELDELLAAVPGVADAGAASFPNSWVDEEIAALVVCRADASLTEESILRHCSRLLPFSAMPKRIEFVTEIPRTASGKIRRAEIAERFAPFREHLFREDRSSWKLADGSVRGTGSERGDMMDVSEDLLKRVLQCANQAAGTSLTLPPDGDLPLEAFQLDSFSLFAFLLELERKCGMKFDETILNHDQFHSIRSAAALIQNGGLGGASR